MSKFTSAALLAALLSGLPVSAPLAAEAAPSPARLAYGLTVAGIPIAQADLTYDDRGGRYALDVAWHTVGLAGIFASASGTVAADGRLLAGRPQPRDYRLKENGGDGPIDVEMSLLRGRVGRLSVEPPAKTGEDIVPVLPEHRRGVTDPLSAALIPAATAPEAVCARTLSVFDGWSRWDVRLSAKAIRDEAPDGMRAPTVVCAARWVPIAGHRAGHRSVRYMAQNEDVEVRLARLADRDVWLPVETTVGTLIGPARATLRSVRSAER